MFYRTDKAGKKQHTHLVFIDKDSLQPGVRFQTSEVNGHIHECEYIPAPTMPDDMGMVEPGVITEPQQAEGIYVLTAMPMPDAKGTPDMHDHGLLDLSVEFRSVRREKKENELEAYNMAKQAYDELSEYNAEWIKNRETAEKYKKGQQWKPEDIAKLENEFRAHIEANLVTPMIDTMVGNAIETRTDWYIMPIEGGDMPSADVLTKAIKYVSDNCDFPLTEVLTFEDEITTGAGAFHWYVDRDENIEGDIKIDRMRSGKLLLGPHEKHDLSDMEVMSFTEWISDRKFRQMWPDKYKEMRGKGKDIGSMAGEKKQEPHMDGTTVSYDKHEGTEVTLDRGKSSDMVDSIKKTYRIVEAWFKEYRKIPIFIYVDELGNDQIYEATEWDMKDVEEAKTIPGLSYYQKKGHKIRVITIAGEMLISDRYPELILNRFPVEVAFASDCGSNIRGKIEDVKSLQDFINKCLSLEVDIINKMQNFMWFIFPESFESPQAEQEFKMNSAKPGYVAKVSSKDAMPEKVETHSFPQGIVGGLELAISLFRQVSLVNNESQGVSSNPNMSAKAMLELKRSAMLGNRKMYDRFSFAKKRLGKVLIQLIPKVISPQRMTRILNNLQIEEAVKQGQITWEEANTITLEPQYSVEQIQAIWDNLDLSKYDVKVWESPYNPTIQEANFEITADLARQGVAIPPEVLIDASSLPYKGKIKQMIAQQRQADQQIEQGKQQTEIQKTMIAAHQGKQGTPAGAGQPMPVNI